MFQYDPELPIVQRREEIAALIRENQVLVVCGETGSGKSTQLPKICLELGRAAILPAPTNQNTSVNPNTRKRLLIGHTQPRRIAARSIAARIAQELDSPLGQLVGYQVRFDEKCGEQTAIKLMTDGILLAESQGDKLFSRYDTIIIDEAHERSLNIDFLIGMMKRILPLRKDLKLIITSATIDAARFAEHFTDQRINRGQSVPVIEVSGRTYPITILYRDPSAESESEEAITSTNLKGDSSNQRLPSFLKRGTRNVGVVSRETKDETELMERAILSAVDELARYDRKEYGGKPGDMLIFLPTERDILEVAKLLRHHLIPGDDAARKTEILPLYARLPVSQQQKVFQVGNYRRIVLTTNVAESSLTVPGIRFVIDTGTARISRYSARSRTQRLPIEPVSQASIDQRAGRCGRIGPGICIRLFSERDYLGRSRYTTPEIQRTNLASIILQTKSLKLGEIEKFPFLDPPRIAAINDGYKTLIEIGALDTKKHLTQIGWKLARMPIDPRIGRMVLAADENGVLNEMLIVAAALETQDPRERPLEHQAKADVAHSPFLDSRSDYIGFLKLWDFYVNLKEVTSRNGLRKAAMQHFLSYNRFREWSDVHVQLLQCVHDAGMKVGPRRVKRDELYGPLHRSILTGNLSGIAQRDSKNEYSVCSSGGNLGKFVLWPGSGLLKKGATESDQQSSPNTVKKEKTSGGDANTFCKWIVASERVETSRRYLRTAAQIEANWIEPLAQHLIQRIYMEPHWDDESGCVHAFERVTLLGIVLVPKRRINFGPIDTKMARDIFIQSALVDSSGEWQSKMPFFSNGKSQEKTPLISNEGCQTWRGGFSFFDHNSNLLEDAKKLQDKLRRGDMLQPQISRTQFYEARIPADVYDCRSLEKWLRESPEHNKSLCMTFADICTEMISDDVMRQFPDTIPTRDGGAVPIEYHFAPGEENDGLTLLVPQNDLRKLEPERLGWLVPGLLLQKITALLKSLPKDIRRQIVPIPDTSKEIIGKIQFGNGDLTTQLAMAVSRLTGRLVKPDDFEMERIPEELRLNIRILDSAGETVGEGRNLIELRRELGAAAIPADAQEMIDPREIAIDHFYHAAKRDIRTQIQWLPNVNRLKVLAQPLPEFDFPLELGRLISLRAIRLDDLSLPKTEAELVAREEEGHHNLGRAVQDVTHLIGPLLESFHEARLAIERAKSSRTLANCIEAKEHLQRLVAPHFLTKTPWMQLREFPRYFRAIPIRFEKLQNGGDAADLQGYEELRRYWTKYLERKELHQLAGIDDSSLETFRWLLEEYRVSLFAQKLGTSQKVSPNRLDKLWETVRK
ncbi:MAG: DUF3418 domain-containing protein [Thermoguttaceae bacterium]